MLENSHPRSAVSTLAFRTSSRHRVFLIHRVSLNLFHSGNCQGAVSRPSLFAELWLTGGLFCMYVYDRIRQPGCSECTLIHHDVLSCPHPALEQEVRPEKRREELVVRWSPCTHTRISAKGRLRLKTTNIRTSSSAASERAGAAVMKQQRHAGSAAADAVHGQNIESLSLRMLCLSSWPSSVRGRRTKSTSIKSFL